MARIRLSTAVDAELLGSARRVRSGRTDAALIDEALGADVQAPRGRRAARALRLSAVDGPREDGFFWLRHRQW